MLKHTQNELSEGAETVVLIKRDYHHTRTAHGLAPSHPGNEAGLLDSVRHADELPVGHGNGPINHPLSLWSHQSHPKDIHP